MVNPALLGRRAVAPVDPGDGDSEGVGTGDIRGEGVADMQHFFGRKSQSLEGSIEYLRARLVRGDILARDDPGEGEQMVVDCGVDVVAIDVRHHADWHITDVKELEGAHPHPGGAPIAELGFAESGRVEVGVDRGEDASQRRDDDVALRAEASASDSHSRSRGGELASPQGADLFRGVLGATHRYLLGYGPNNVVVLFDDGAVEVEKNATNPHGLILGGP